MARREWKKIGIGAILCILLILIMLSTLTFEMTKKDTFEDLTNQPNELDSLVFKNESDLSEEEVREIVEEKRNTLKDFFESATYYKPSEINREYTSADDENYLVVDESFLNELNALVTTEIYNSYFEQFVEITKDQDVAITERLYRGPKDIFDDLFYKSAIAMIDVNEEKTLLDRATNEYISAVINIRYCDEEQPDICSKNEYYVFELQKEENDWQVAEFTEEKKLNKA